MHILIVNLVSSQFYFRFILMHILIVNLVSSQFYFRFILMHKLIVNLVSSRFYFCKYCEYESFDAHVDC
jgi:hypothetical protein